MLRLESIRRDRHTHQPHRGRLILNIVGVFSVTCVMALYGNVVVAFIAVSYASLRFTIRGKSEE